MLVIVLPPAGVAVTVTVTGCAAFAWRNVIVLLDRQLVHVS
jgi:hypothetical protein